MRKLRQEYHKSKAYTGPPGQLNKTPSQDKNKKERVGDTAQCHTACLVYQLFFLLLWQKQVRGDKVDTSVAGKTAQLKCVRPWVHGTVLLIPQKTTAGERVSVYGEKKTKLSAQF